MSKERPILFSGPMVRALLDGSKTQTRRVVKPQPDTAHDGEPYWFIGGYRVWGYRPAPAVPLRAGGNPLPCPYGQRGDRLWVREAFDFLPSGGLDQPQACEIVYWATGSTEPRSAPLDYNPMIYGHQKVRPSIHMPRWASRITLEITGVRVERLQDISEADAQAEGATPIPDPCDHVRLACADIGCSGPQPHRVGFRALWRDIHGPDSWDANPWVWAVTFRRLP